MHGYDAKDMARSFRTVRENTIKVAEDIPEDRYGFRPGEGSRSAAETLAHIAVTPRWPRQLHGDRLTAVDFSMFGTVFARLVQAEGELAKCTKAQILDALRSGGEEFGSWLETLTDEVLAEQVNFPPPVQPSSKTRFEMLLSTKEHEMHHRSQLMVIERMVGIVPHLTREMQARFAQMQQATAKA